MSLVDLRGDQFDEDAFHQDFPIPPHLDEPAPPQPGDRGYTHSILYDEARFPTEAHLDRLMEHVRAQYGNLLWVLVPAAGKNLSIEEQFCATTAQFREQGYVAQLDPLQLGQGRPPRLRQSHVAWHAFFFNTVIADAVLTACHTLPHERRGNTIFRNAQDTVLIPIIGRRDKTDLSPNRSILVEQDGLLVAPKTFGVQRTAYPAFPHAYGDALEKGRNKALPFWTSNGRDEMIERASAEVQAWSDHLGDQFSTDGLLLWIAQTLGWLRVQATDWQLRENNGYLMSGTHWADDNPRARDSKDVYVEQLIEDIGEGLRRPHGRPFKIPIIKRPPDSAVLDVHSILAGGIGLDDEQASHDEAAARMNLPRGELGGVADWVSRLRRFHRARLTAPIVDQIHEMMTGRGVDLDTWDSDVWAGANLVRSQFPDAVWNDIVVIAENCPDGTPWIDVGYRWNRNATDPIRIERQGDGVVIFGPMLAINAQSLRWWTTQAELFRNQGSLTV